MNHRQSELIIALLFSVSVAMWAIFTCLLFIGSMMYSGSQLIHIHEDLQEIKVKMPQPFIGNDTPLPTTIIIPSGFYTNYLIERPVMGRTLEQRFDK